MDLLSLSPEQFENIIFDIVVSLGLRNAVWRTPGSDIGRDIEGEHFISDLSGQYQRQKWYVECKRYTNSVDWPTVWNKISYAEAHSADILLFVTSSSLSPQAIDQVRIWNESNKRPIIRFWGEIEINSKLNLYPQIAIKYGLTNEMGYNFELFYPLIQLLLKTTSAISPDTGTPSNAKLWLTHTLSELISARTTDMNIANKYHFRPHSSEDQFDWCDYSSCSFKNFDKYSLRVLLAYINLISKSKFTIKQETPNRLKIEIKKDLISSELTHLNIISAMSNFIITTVNKEIDVSITEEAR